MQTTLNDLRSDLAWLRMLRTSKGYLVDSIRLLNKEIEHGKDNLD